MFLQQLSPFLRSVLERSSPHLRPGIDSSVNIAGEGPGNECTPPSPRLGFERPSQMKFGTSTPVRHDDTSGPEVSAEVVTGG
jgi:hypothetical protein